MTDDGVRSFDNNLALNAEQHATLRGYIESTALPFFEMSSGKLVKRTGEISDHVKVLIPRHRNAAGAEQAGGVGWMHRK